MNHGTSRRDAHRANVLRAHARGLDMTVSASEILTDLDGWEARIHEAELAHKRAKEANNGPTAQ